MQNQGQITLWSREITIVRRGIVENIIIMTLTSKAYDRRVLVRRDVKRSKIERIEIQQRIFQLSAFD